MSSGENDQLNSWKAIASYLGRDVRTVQLWEKEQALPIHRQRHSKLASVFAYKSELDRWLQDRTDRPRLGSVRQTRPTADSAAAQPVLVNGKAAASPLPSLTETPVDGDPPLTGFRQQRRPAFDKWKAPTIILLVSAVVSWIVYWNHERRVTLPEARTVPVTTLPGVETMPAFSPDGRHIAYVRAEHERRNPNLWRKLPGPSSIYVKLVEAGTELRLTRGRATDSFPAWSPDGQYIAFFRNAPGASVYYIVSALGGPERRVPGNAGDVSAGLDWLPDGKGLIVSEVSEGSHGSPLTAVSIDTGDRRILTSPPNTTMGDIYPKFSPDGKWLAFIRAVAYGNADVYVMAANGGPARQLTFDHVWKEQVAWMPDGRRILFPSLQSSTGRLWQIALEGGSPRAITPDGQGIAMPTVARRGHRLAYVLSTTNINLWSVNVAASGRPKALVPGELIVSTRSQFDPQYSPDGKKIAFLSDRSGSEEIWTADAEGETLSQLTHFAGPPTGSPSWSNDGSEIAFDTRSNGNPDIWIVRAEGGALRRITTSSAEDVVPSWSRDGNWIYFASNRGGDFQIWKVRSMGESPSNSPVQVTKGGGFCAMETLDGKYLYFTKGRGKAGLWRRAIGNDANGQEEPVITSLQHWGWWTLAPQGILFFEEHAEMVRLVLSDPTGAAFRLIGDLRAPLIQATRAITVSPDGARVVYAQIDPGGADIMALDNIQ